MEEMNSSDVRNNIAVMSPPLGAIKRAVDGPEGRYLGLRFTDSELSRVVQLIEQQWLVRIEQIAPQHVEAFAKVGVGHYHEVAHLIDHVTAWPKKERILSQQAVNEIRQMSIMQALEREYGKFKISDEEHVGREELYWRLVRPNYANDVGPLHADHWFHVLDPDFEIAADEKTVKVWTAISVEPGVSGFRYVLGSHTKDWPHHSEFRDGSMKPQIDFDENSVPLEVFRSRPGEAIIFHENLLHGGIKHQGQLTRVSIEWTIIVPRK